MPLYELTLFRGLYLNDTFETNPMMPTEFLTGYGKLGACPKILPCYGSFISAGRSASEIRTLKLRKVGSAQLT